MLRVAEEELAVFKGGLRLLFREITEHGPVGILALNRVVFAGCFITNMNLCVVQLARH